MMPYKRYIFIDNTGNKHENCRRCLDIRKREYETDINNIAESRSKSDKFRNIDNLIDDILVNRKLFNKTSSKLYKILSTDMMRFKYNTILNELFDNQIESHPIDTSIHNAKKYRDIIEIEKYFKLILEVFSIDINLDNDITNLLNINRYKQVLFIQFSSNWNNNFDNNPNDYVINFKKILFLFNDLIKKEIDISSNMILCHEIDDINKIEIEEYCKGNNHGTYYYISIREIEELTEFINDNFSEEIVITDSNLDKLITRINNMEDEEKMQVILYLTDQFNTFFEDFRKYLIDHNILVNNKILENRTIINNKMLDVINANNKININTVTKTINKIEQNNKQLRRLGRTMDQYHNQIKDKLFIRNTRFSWVYLYLIPYFIKYNNTILDFVIDNNYIINIINKHFDLDEKLNNITKFYEQVDNIHEYFAYKQINNYYDHDVPFNNIEDDFEYIDDMDYDDYYDEDHNHSERLYFEDIADYYILLHFIKYNYELKNDSKLVGINVAIKQYLTDNSRITVRDINTNKNDKRVYNILETGHSTSLVKLRNEFIYYDSNHHTYVYTRDYLNRNLNTSDNFKTLTTNLNIELRGIQACENVERSEISNDEEEKEEIEEKIEEEEIEELKEEKEDKCIDEGECKLNEGKCKINILEDRGGYCSQWGEYFILLVLMNMRNINNYQDLVDLIRITTLGDKITLNKRIAFRNQKNLIRSLMLKLYLLYINNIITLEMLKGIFDKDTVNCFIRIFNNIHKNTNTYPELRIFSYDIN